MKPVLLIAESKDFNPEAIESLSSRFEVRLADYGRKELIANIGDVDVLWVRLRNTIDDEVLDAASQLKTIATNTTGLNHIDVEGANRRNVRVVSLKGETEFLDTIRATAEHTLALTLALLRKIPQASDHVRNGDWNRDRFRGNEIFEKTVGVIGYGRLGKIVAGYFEALGAEVITHSRDLSPGSKVDGRSVVTWKQIWATSDVVTLHANFEPENDCMVSHQEFEMARPSCVFVNTARGELVEEASLIKAIESKQIAGAAVDVIRDEQTVGAKHNCLVEFSAKNPRLLITPHIGGNTFESRANTECFLAKRVLDLNG